MIKPCTCKHEYQDKRYGKNMRVHNIAVSKVKGGVAYRCTVCNKTKEKGEV